MVILSKFPERLLEHMNEQSLNAPALARALNTDRTNITRYLRGERIPLFPGFVDMLNFFNCSADYLLGIIDIPTDQSFHPVATPFGTRLREVMESYGATQYGIEKDLNISGSVMYNWLNNKSLPALDNLVKLAKYMDCSVDFLLGRIR